MIYLILAGAGKNIGGGHLMRCRSLARALENSGSRCVFRDVPDSGETFAGELRDAEEEAGASADAVLLDSYAVTPELFSGIREKLPDTVPLLYMDDLAAFAYPADVVINYNRYAFSCDYETLYARARQKKPHLVLGPAYTPLREMFADSNVRIRKQIREVLVSTGGADTQNMGERIYRHCAEDETKYPDRIFHFLIGAYAAEEGNDPPAWIAEAAGRKNVRISRQVNDMKTLMETCDAAVSAAGMTLHELCVLGVPAVTYVSADNQLMNARSFDEARLFPCAGDCREEGFFENLDRELERLFSLTPEEISQIQKRLSEAEDGDGARRLAAELNRLVQFFRSKKMKDAAERGQTAENTEDKEA